MWLRTRCGVSIRHELSSLVRIGSQIVLSGAAEVAGPSNGDSREFSVVSVSAFREVIVVRLWVKTPCPGSGFRSLQGFPGRVVPTVAAFDGADRPSRPVHDRMVQWKARRYTRRVAFFTPTSGRLGTHRACAPQRPPGLEQQRCRSLSRLLQLRPRGGVARRHTPRDGSSVAHIRRRRRSPRRLNRLELLENLEIAGCPAIQGSSEAASDLRQVFDERVTRCSAM